MIEEHEQEQLIRSVAEQIQSRGEGRGHWSSFVQQILHPKIDPRTLLRMALRKALEQANGGDDDTSYRRPSRRPSSGGCIRPSRVALVPKIRFIVDTSGSMSQYDLGFALGMIGKVLSSFRLRDGIEVMVGDTEVQSCDVIFDPKKLDCRGGGGTDMRKLLVEAAKLEPKPQLILIATDGYTPWPSTDIGIPVVACLTRESTKRDVPKWIKTIVLV